MTHHIDTPQHDINHVNVNDQWHVIQCHNCHSINYVTLQYLDRNCCKKCNQYFCKVCKRDYDNNPCRFCDIQFRNKYGNAMDFADAVVALFILGILGINIMKYYDL